MPSGLLIHCIGDHPINFGYTSLPLGEIHHLDEVGMNGINMPSVFLVKSKWARPDNHLVGAIRRTPYIPGTVEVIETLGKLGFLSLRAIIYDKEGLYDGSDVISIASLGSISVQNGKAMGVVLHLNPSGMNIEFFEARPSRKNLPLEWIYPSILRVA